MTIGRSIPIFPQNDLDVPTREKAYIKVKVPFCDKLSGMICTKFFGRDMVYTLRVKFQDNQGVVQFRNGSDELAQLRKDNVVGILDLRSIGYFKVGYQKMVNMAESSKAFKMYHYQQIKCETKTEVDQYMRVTGRYGNGKSKKMQDSEKQSELGRESDPYPWLTDEDPRRYQTDEEILYEKIDLSNSALSRKEKTRLLKMLIKYRDAFRLRDEIGGCPNLEADIKVIDDSTFFVRPFPISESDKPFMDEQMERLVSLGILSKNSTSHTSPVMLITRKLTEDKRPVVDFRLLNTRLLRRNTSIPLMSDVLSILGNSECEVVSCVDIKVAYHSIRLTEKSKEYCGILPYFGSLILDDGEGNLDTVLCIPISKVHILLNAYHSSILGGHTGITKCYHTISQRFYFPNLAENLRAYITGCHVCQLFKKGKDFKRPYQKGINLNAPAMTKISMDIKQMPINKGYSHLLVLLCEVTNYMVALLLMSTTFWMHFKRDIWLTLGHQHI